LDEEGYALINKLRECGTAKKHFSFATKYCHHCRPNKYPVYDALNMWVMSIHYGYEYVDDPKSGSEFRPYQDFVECYNLFCKDFIAGIEHGDDEGFYIDKYIQAIGNGAGLRELLF